MEQEISQEDLIFLQNLATLPKYDVAKDLKMEEFAKDMFVYNHQKYYVFKNAEFDEFFPEDTADIDKYILLGAVCYFKGEEYILNIPEAEYKEAVKYYLKLKKAFSTEINYGE